MRAVFEPLGKTRARLGLGYLVNSPTEVRGKNGAHRGALRSRQYADDGDDIVEAVGDYIYLDGGWGDDTLAASGGYNYVVGQGGVDTCFNGGEGGCTCEIKDCGDEDEPSAAAAP